MANCSGTSRKQPGKHRTPSLPSPSLPWEKEHLLPQTLENSNCPSPHFTNGPLRPRRLKDLVVSPLRRPGWARNPGHLVFGTSISPYPSQPSRFCYIVYMAHRKLRPQGLTASLTKSGALPQHTRGPAVSFYPIFFNPTTQSPRVRQGRGQMSSPFLHTRPGRRAGSQHLLVLLRILHIPQHLLCSSPFRHTNFTSKDTETQRHVRT